MGRSAISSCLTRLKPRHVSASVLASRVAGALLAAALLVTAGEAAHAEPRHGLSIFGDLKYPAGFSHFDYVNPDAPKGGRIVTMGTGSLTTYDSFNGYILKGDAAQNIELLFDSLMTRANDEPDAMYGLVAESADVAADGMSVTFRLRPEAKFSDGTPVTADDVVTSFTLIKEKGHPGLSMPIRDVVKAEALDPHTVKYTFQGELIRDLPVTVAGLPILSKAFYATQPFEETSLKPPLGSGPYRIGAFNPGTYVSFQRRDDYWAKDLPVNRGRFNFDEVRIDYFRDRTVALEAIKSGNLDLREEFTSVSWATAYDIPAVREGRLVKATIPDARPSGAQGFFINTRRDKFKDPRVRKALDLAFDYEWSNSKLFYKLYTRTQSYFENSDMKATGKASPEEAALLAPYKDKLPANILDEPYAPPVTDGSGNNRDNLKQAFDLLKEAGWTIGADRVARNAKGEALDVEILMDDSLFERIIGPYVTNLNKIGVKANARLVDSAQYEQRMKTFDFDMTTQRYALRLTPGIEMRSYWGSDAAKTNGSFNLPGIADPIVDGLIDKVVAAKSRAELVAAARSIDRVLRASHYWVPHWYKASHNLAYWDKFGRPAVQPKYDEGILDTWWIDPAKAAALKPAASAAGETGASEGKAAP